jgi:hypothetical protein
MTDQDLAQGKKNNETVPIPAAFSSWQFEPAEDTAGIAFGLGESEDIPVWRTELPADLDQASQQLNSDQAQIADTLAALNTTPDRIDGLVRQAQVAGTAGVSFDTSGIDALSEPEADLLDMVQTINSPSIGVSFAVGDEKTSKIESVFTQFNDDMTRLLRLVANFAWVETEVGGDLLARSVVSWTGDMDTSWASGLKDEIYQLHKRSLSQALATRNIALHAITITAQSALKLSVLLATPGGGLLALPMVWKYVKQIMADVQRYKEITKVSI